MNQMHPLAAAMLSGLAQGGTLNDAFAPPPPIPKLGFAPPPGTFGPGMETLVQSSLSPLRQALRPGGPSFAAIQPELIASPKPYQADEAMRMEK